jgi:hypothetical protein
VRTVAGAQGGCFWRAWLDTEGVQMSREVGTTAMTARQPSKEVMARRAVAAATQARRPRPGRQAHRRGTPPLHTSAGLALTAAGLICGLAVHIHTRAVNVQTAGIIVTVLGLAWLWIPVRNKGASLRRQFNRAMRYLAWDPGEGSTVRCSLAELLGSPGDEPGERAAD